MRKERIRNMAKVPIQVSDRSDRVLLVIWTWRFRVKILFPLLVSIDKKQAIFCTIGNTHCIVASHPIQCLNTINGKSIPALIYWRNNKPMRHQTMWTNLDAGIIQNLYFSDFSNDSSKYFCAMTQVVLFWKESALH